MHDCKVLSIARRSQRVSLLQSIQMTHGHVFGVDVAYLHATDKSSSGSHAETHRRLMAFLFHGSSFQIQNTTRILRFLSRELFAHLVNVFRVDHFKERRSVPVILRVIQYRRNRIGNINNSSSIARDNKEKPIGSFQNEMFQFLIGEKRWFVTAVSVGVASS